ncbi:TonB-dependent receptor plug domain-containing protein [Microvirga guangxiensis]|uniref:Vitamin B12 transporter n=1 Tax=Microvirga guangxiensis TaxID=549386 RepID=A0A1G5LLF7_9HYPH|nr:TonB-dependent receptor [Microvirga guangxiensis]SCZ13128.1 vitamin B12 transporter [Microvirga guangxiensis]
MIAPSCRILAASVSLCALSFSAAYAQTVNDPVPLPDIVVTATRSPLALSQAGSAISVITAEEIEKESLKSPAEVLRRVPGVTVVETGGAGTTTTVRIRGAEASQTLVLIDGIRVNDPSTDSGEFDFSNLAAIDIERIEVLRGPQSAIYGSDAMGGVINIITRKGQGAPRFSVGLEGGSYGTVAGRAAVSGSNGPISYAFSTTGFDTSGFSRYGYRIGRIEDALSSPLEKDGAQRVGAAGRVSVALSPDVEFEVGGYASRTNVAIDNGVSSFEFLPDGPSKTRQQLYEGHARLTANTFDGILKNTFLVSGSRTDRDYKLIGSYFLPSLYWDEYGYQGERLSAEYQGDLKLGAFGLLTFGTKIEQENLLSTSRNVLPFPTDEVENIDASQHTRSAYALHQFSPIENLHLSLSGRIDDIEDGDTFGTWRATAAYEIPSSGTKLRASVGTGAKAPTLYQKFDPFSGTADLESERSVGFDVGIDQRLADDRVLLSATFFANRFRNLIAYGVAETCRPEQVYGCFINVNRARTSGVELSADVDVVPAWLRVKATYTYLEAFDTESDLRLARRPEHQGRLGFSITPLTGLSIEPSVVFVGSRFSSPGEINELAPYARFDIYADYKVNETFSIYARAENLTDARYQEVYDYGTAGRSFYAGLRATW